MKIWTKETHFLKYADIRGTYKRVVFKACSWYHPPISISLILRPNLAKMKTITRRRLIFEEIIWKTTGLPILWRCVMYVLLISDKYDLMGKSHPASRRKSCVRGYFTTYVTESRMTDYNNNFGLHYRKNIKETDIYKIILPPSCFVLYLTFAKKYFSPLYA